MIRGVSGHASQCDAQRGFTIVELLVVIVVIGILAAITVVSYRGVQQRAYNVSRITAARQALEMVNTYVALNGAYPFTGGGGRCIGEGYPDNACWGVNSSSPVPVSLSDDINTPLKTVATLPRIGYGAVDMGYWRGIGPVYNYRTSRTVDGEPRRAIIVYFLDGINQDCGLQGVVRNTDTGTPGVVENSNTYATVTTSPRNTATNGSGTYCIVAANAP